MTVTTVFNDAATTLAASTTYNWSGSELWNRNVRAFLVQSTNGSTGTLAANNIERVRVKAGANTIFEMDYLYLRAYLARVCGNDIGGSAVWFPIPLHLPDLPPALRYKCGFPSGMEPTVELVTGSACSTTVRIGAVIGATPEQFSPLVSMVTPNWVLSAANQRHDFDVPGWFRFVGLPSTGIDNIEVGLGGNKVQDTTPGMTGAFMRVVQEQFPYTSYQFTADINRRSPNGKGHVQVDTNASWVTSEMSIVSYMPSPGPYSDKGRAA